MLRYVWSVTEESTVVADDDVMSVSFLTPQTLLK